MLKASGSTGSKLSNVKGVAAGGFHTCAWFGDVSADAPLKCWGDDAERQLGNGESSATAALYPSQDVTGDLKSSDIEQLEAGAAFTCALRTDKATVQCWGDNQYGQLGNGDAQKGTDRATPVTVDRAKLLYN